MALVVALGLAAVAFTLPGWVWWAVGCLAGALLAGLVTWAAGLASAVAVQLSYAPSTGAFSYARRWGISTNESKDWESVGQAHVRVECPQADGPVGWRLWVLFDEDGVFLQGYPSRDAARADGERLADTFGWDLVVDEDSDAAEWPLWKDWAEAFVERHRPRDPSGP